MICISFYYDYNDYNYLAIYRTASTVSDDFVKFFYEKRNIQKIWYFQSRIFQPVIFIPDFQRRQ